MLKPGLYEQIISQTLFSELASVSENRKEIENLDKTEAPQALAEYIAQAARQALEAMPDDTEGQVQLVNRLISVLAEKREDLLDKTVDVRAQKLLQIFRENDPLLMTKGASESLPRPVTSMAVSSLFTGALNEPKMFSELQKEILSADRVDMLVSFVKWSGLRLMIDALRDFTRKGGHLRVITTSYMGATEIKAVTELSELPNTEVRISYDTARTRLHAKAYMFYRETGFNTAYVGSSNLSNVAMSTGLEWNLKLTAMDQPDTMHKISEVFESYWNAEEFEVYEPSSYDRLLQALKGAKSREENYLFLFDIRPYPYQQAILDQLRAEREIRGFHRNLLVAATGTGKTVIAALDYKSWCKDHPKAVNRLLFIAHREEILKQSRATFRGVLRDANFGDLWVGSSKPSQLDYLFISVQTMNSQMLWKRLPANFYDFIIVDETHHASAASYVDAITTFTPQILLGLTATPERMDGKSILPYFDRHIAAEIRLPEAIERKLLCPFQYFGVSDTIDLDDLKWTRGGYDRAELNKIYTLSGARARERADMIIRNLRKYVADIEEVKALGFCVSVQHAHFMADYFCEAGIPSLALDSQSPEEIRASARTKLIKGEILVIFAVDLYNEGVDIPEINTVLFLRPTESLTIFLQQLGRGLRLNDGKDCLTVLDFIGAANRRYNFEEKFRALLPDTRHSVKEEIQRGFIGAPRGCYIQLEQKAREVILDNISKNFTGRSELVHRIQMYVEDMGHAPTLSEFLEYAHLSPMDIYGRRNITFSRLCVAAGVRKDFSEAMESILQRVMFQFTYFDSRRLILFLLDILSRLDDVDFGKLPQLEQRMLRMFYISVWQAYADDLDSDEVLENLYTLADCPVMLAELRELLDYQYQHIDFIDSVTDLGFECPLDVHCTYSQRQILAAMDYANFSAMRQGVLYLPEKKADIFLITLIKNDKDYSPSTSYNDYAISRTLFHWQSQSTTSATSPTAQRYIHHQEQGSRILLFVREYKETTSGTAIPYTFLGQATYVSHTGSRPIDFTWKLEKEIPAKYMPKVQQAVSI